MANFTQVLEQLAEGSQLSESLKTKLLDAVGGKFDVDFSGVIAKETDKIIGKVKSMFGDKATPEITAWLDGQAKIMKSCKNLTDWEKAAKAFGNTLKGE